MGAAMRDKATEQTGGANRQAWHRKRQPTVAVRRILIMEHRLLPLLRAFQIIKKEFMRLAGIFAYFHLESYLSSTRICETLVSGDVPDGVTVNVKWNCVPVSKTKRKR